MALLFEEMQVVTGVCVYSEMKVVEMSGTALVLLELTYREYAEGGGHLLRSSSGVHVATPTPPMNAKT